MDKPKILLIIGGGIAAGKSLELLRLLRRENFTLRCILTEAAQQFVTPLAVSSFAGNKVHTDLFDLEAEAEMSHIELARFADLLLVCPATADLLARAANGHASDLASAVMLASAAPLLLVPAMNTRMWEHPATRRNVRSLREDGAIIIEPEHGLLACGETGSGRLPEPEQLLTAITARLDTLREPPKSGELAGKRVIITAGPTREYLDPVRFLSNASSGRQGYALAAAVRALGAETILVSGPVDLPAPPGVKMILASTACDMLAAVESALPADIFAGIAAIADWRPQTRSDNKLKSVPKLDLIENPDILASIANRHEQRPELVIGFAAETENIEINARSKLLKKACDWILANDISKDVIGSEYNQVSLFTRSGREDWPRMRKTELAQKLAQRLALALHQQDAAPRQIPQ